MYFFNKFLKLKVYTHTKLHERLSSNWSRKRRIEEGGASSPSFLVPIPSFDRKYKNKKVALAQHQELWYLFFTNAASALENDNYVFA